MPAVSDRTTVDGRTTTKRTAAMLKEARRISGLSPRVTQGGFNAGGVAASAGTHDRDALDLALAGYTAKKWQAWEAAMWKVGFAAWQRPFIYNVWPQHGHAIPKGGDLSRGARGQEAAFRNQRDGLAGNRPYPRIGKYASQTWEKYQAGQAGKKIKIGAKYYPDIASVSVYYLAASWKTGKFSRHTWYVQNWLKQRGLYKSALDGIPGPKTKAAFDTFRRSIGLSGNDAKGTPGDYSVRQLAIRANSKYKKVRTGK